MASTRPAPGRWMPTVAVGYNGTPAAMVAAEWAAEEAQRRQALLRIVHVVRDADRHLAQRSCSIEAGRLSRRMVDLPVFAGALTGNPRSTLAHVARRSSLVVLGATRPTPRRRAADDLALHLVRNTETPLVVVPAPAGGAGVGMPRVVGLIATSSRGAVVEAVTAASRARHTSAVLAVVQPRPSAGPAPGSTGDAATHHVPLTGLDLLDDLWSVRRISPDMVGAFLAAMSLGPGDLVVVGRTRDPRTDEVRTSGVLRRLVQGPPCPVLIVPDDPLWSSDVRTVGARTFAADTVPAAAQPGSADVGDPRQRP